MLAVLLACSWCAQAAQAAGPTIVRGTVTDLSATPHRSVASVPVTLEVQRSGRTLQSVRGRTDAHGAFALAAPALSAGASYAVTAVYRRVPYSVSVAPGQASRSVQVPVYETTSADDSLAAMRVVIGLRRHGSDLGVFEQWFFTNAGTRTIVGSDPATGRGAARFPLPPGATHVVVRDAGPAASAGVAQGNVVVNTVVRPATGMNAASFHQVTFTFDVPSSADHPTLFIPTRYFIGALQVATVGARLQAPGFTPTTLSDGKTSLPAVEAQAVPPGSTLAVGVDGPPAAPPGAPPAAVPPTFPTGSVAVTVELGFGALLLFGLFGRRVWAGPRKRPALQRERSRLVEAIARLDLMYEHGALAAGEYQRRRAAQKSRLLAISRQLGK